MIGGDIPDRPTIQLEDNILEEVEYLTDHGDSSANRNEQEEDSDWDASTISVVGAAYTPQRVDVFRNNTISQNGANPGVFSPLQSRSNTPTSYGMSASSPDRPRGTASNFLSSIRSPPEAKARRPQFEAYNVDNRTRTPHYSASEPVSVDAFMAEDEASSQGSDYQASALSYGASKYLQSRPSLSITQNQPSFRQSRVSLQSPANRSVASVQSASSVNSRRYSMMSHRSSTSMSLLFGEVINLEDQSRFTTRSRDTNAADIDLEGGLEGLEIGGGPRHLMTSEAVSARLGPKVSLGIPADTLSKSLKQVKLLGQTATRGMQTMASQTRHATQRVIHRYRPPLSPHARALEDLEYLQQAHKQKVGQLTENSTMEDHYDFVLLLKPQEVYRFWAEILDFRAEHLGDEFETAMMEPVIETVLTNSTDCRESVEDPPEELEPLRQRDVYSTPQTGIRRRPKTPATDDKTPRTLELATSIPRPSYINSLFSNSTATMPGHHPFTSSKRMNQRMSLFERAVGIPASPMMGGVDDSFAGTETPLQEPRSAVRRRWGNHAINTQGSSTANLFSPPVRSLTRGVSSVRKVRVSQASDGKQGDDEQENEDTENVNPNRLKSAEDIPNPVIPRGIAARTNGMLPFLSALKRGIVVRRHRSGKEAVYCKILSNDGGDTIQYQLVDTTEAMVAFKEQRVRHNRHLTHSSSPNSVRALSREWACLDGAEDGSLIHNFNVPDHVAAHRYREKLTRDRVKKHIMDIAYKAANSGFVRAADLVAVHPASHMDPRHPGVRQGALGTASLRKSKSEYYTAHTFSIVVNASQRFGPNNNKSKTTTKSEPSDNKWYSGEGNELQFKTLDFEAATEGEYWLIFRGFLLLQRDVVVGRFAAERRAGIGGGNRNKRNPDGSDDGDNNGDEVENLLHRDEFLEPVTVGALERAIVNLRKLDKTYMEGTIAPGAVPPPSDYFLGFRSPGTQIWSRLRLAGLETTRVYAVDTRRVMIKVRCPEDRLTDVAEVLRIKMKTRDGTYAAFREDTASHFRPLDDPHDIPAIYQGQMASLLRSKDRQNIIDFIIGSRIRDSGAELGPTTDVGKMIQARIPLHMKEKLDSLVRPWVYYWKRENWTTRPKKAEQESVKESTHDEESGLKPNGNQDAKHVEDEVPDFLTRFFVGAFHQPLDTIEEYFGEQVTFYFAWLQHCARHLLVLTFVGLIVTICQLYTDNFDHPIRPCFAMVVMIWTFMVLLNWRKRSNLLAYKWGSMDYKVQETPRPEFHGEYVVDDITKEWVVKYPKWKRWLKYTISVPITCFFTGMAALLILLVHANRDIQMTNYAQQRINPTSEPFKFEFSLDNIGKRAPIVENKITREMLVDPTFWVVMGALPALLGLCIPIMNLILMRISVMLNNFENYRTESEYRTHLIIKVFSFRFVSQFGTLYYYAAISISKGDTQSIENGMIRMATSVMIYTTVAHWWSIFLQVYIFMFVRNIRRFLYKRKLQHELKMVEIEDESISHALSDAESRQIRIINKRMLLDQAQDDVWFELMNPPHDSFPEYITAVVQFSFVACFSVVLPITPLFCLLNFLISMRYDAYKLCRGRRRPLAQKTGGIGIWEHLLHIVAVIAVLTNCWLVAFTTKQLVKLEEKVGELGLFAIVVAWEHGMLLIKYVMQTTMSPFPKVVRDELKRKQNVLDKERYTNMRTKDLGRRGKTEKHSGLPRTCTSFDEDEFRQSLGLAKRKTASPGTMALKTITSFDTVSDTDTMSA